MCDYRRLHSLAAAYALRDLNGDLEDRPMAVNSQNALRNHPVYQLVDDLTSYLRIGPDWIAFAELLSLSAGRMAMPINLDVVSDQWALDLNIADRIACLLQDAVLPIDTYKVLRAEEEQGFTGRYVLWFRRDYPKLYDDLVGFMARAPDSLESAPSIWRIRPGFVEPTNDTPTLRLIASAADRNLDGYAASFASAVGSPVHRDRLTQAIETLCPRLNYRCSFRDRLCGILAPTSMLVLERMLQLFANLRRVKNDFRGEAAITAGDYEAVRFVLVNLPLVPVDRVITAQTLKTAEQIHAGVHADGYQLALPDQSDAGHLWFTRNHVAKWSDLGYTTIKKHLQEMEDDGLLVSTVDRNNRQHGRVIHYRFAENRAPPFGWNNPFAALPELAPI